MSFFNGKDEPANGFTVEELEADASRKLAVLRALRGEFINENDDAPLSDNDHKVVARVPPAYLEKGAVICEVAPEVPGISPDTGRTLRLIYTAVTLYTEVFWEAHYLARDIRVAIWRKLLAGIPLARLVHRITSAFATTKAGNWLTSYLDQMKAVVARPPRKPRKKRGSNPAA